MLGITCALYDEAAELIKLLTRQKTDSIYHYAGTLKGVPVSLFLTKPGLHKNKNQLIKWLKTGNITSLLQTGYCGALSNRYRPGDVCMIGRVSCFSKPYAMDFHSIPENSPLAMDFHSLLTVERPILTMNERDNISDTHTADVIDMEAWHICHLLKTDFTEIKTRVIKIVGDVPGEELLMNHEIHMRSFFKEHRLKNRIKIAVKTGRPFFELYRRKRMLQNTLKAVVLDYIENLHEISAK
jgi:nucleoside phosphorylase